ncbi:hypothetical protein DC366_02420 [Pelagivirga sediminicola]|uniref:DUF488 domain-containing protein n=1 Tax=Pelagivirga sediminicola TaxID=2170575 RepID=A0A2T7GBM8_9RHOB|nr:DUF488 family protein [Pelagivirga sediminicola]PVA11822.1 hypothetical protein DC366_02420 [Pelagivirga sediminicola]
MDIRTRRAYDEMAENDGYRVLADRLWPRGVAKEDLELDEWGKEVAPSDDLRKWYDHDTEKWDEFRRRYARELDDCDAADDLAKRAKDGRVTLIYAAKDENHNNAVALRDWLKEKLG